MESNTDKTKSNISNKIQFFDWDRALSNTWAEWIVALGPRTIGKTFGIRLKFPQNWKKRRERFVEIVRHKDEVEDLAPNYFMRVQEEGFFTDWEFNGNQKGEVFAKPPRENDWELIGWVLPLTDEQKIKKRNVYTRVRIANFDEFIIEQSDRFHRYLPNEWTRLNGIVSSIGRQIPGQQKTLLQVCMEANAVGFMCPHLEKLGVKNPLELEYGEHRFKTRPDLPGPNVLFNYIDPINAALFEAETITGRALAGTEEGKKIFENKFAVEADKTVIKKPKHARYLFGFVFCGDTFGVWIDEKAGYMHITEKAAKGQHVYALTREDKSADYDLIKKTAPQMKTIVNAFYRDRVRYEDIKTREKLFSALKFLGVA